MVRFLRARSWLETSMWVSAFLGIALSSAAGIPPGLARTEPVLDTQIASDERLTIERELAWQRQAGAQLLSEVGGSGGDNCHLAPVTQVTVGPSGSPNTVTIGGDMSSATTANCFSGTIVVWWEAFEIDKCANVVLDFCGTSPTLTPLFTSVWTTCAPDGSSCGSTVVPNDSSNSLCGKDDSNKSFFYDSLPAGTYYYPIIVPDPAISYVMHITAEECSGACPGCVGSCCDTTTETCTDDLTMDQCSGAQETWTARSKCCEAECRDSAGPEFDSSGVDLLSRVSLEDVAAFNGTPGDPHAGGVVWGYTSPSGREYAIMSTTTGTVFIDVTDPRSPVILAFINNGGVDQIWRDMATFDEYAYVVTDGEGVGLQIIDLSDIDAGNVTFVRSTDLGLGLSKVHNIDVNPDSGFLYLCIPDIDDGLGLTAVSLADPVNPVRVGNWTDTEPGVRCHNARVVTYTSGPNTGREIAFCFAEEDGLVIIDVTNKETMFKVSVLAYPTRKYCHQGWTTDDKQFVVFDDELDERDGAVDRTTTYVADVSDLSKPVLASTFEYQGCNIDHNLMVRGDFVYLANYAAGFRVLDFSSPPNLTAFAHFDSRPEDNATNFEGASGVFSDFPSGIVVLSDRQRGLFVFDNPEPPPPPIPVASTWGLSAMVLLMLAGGTIVARRAMSLRPTG